MLDILEAALTQARSWTELRYHRKRTLGFTVEDGVLKDVVRDELAGIAVRVLRDGVFGFSCATELTVPAIVAAIARAERCVDAMADVKESKVGELPTGRLARGAFTLPGFDELVALPLEEKLGRAMAAQSALAKGAAAICSATAGYREVVEEKALVTTDGAAVSWRLARPESRLSAIAEEGGEQALSQEGVGGTGPWECLFRNADLDALIERTAKRSVDLLAAKVPEGGLSTVILDPGIAGLLAHEAIGHTVEADIALSGSVALGKIGERIGSELVTLADSGASEFTDGAGGSLPVDDEGVLTERTTIIEGGVLRSLLHNRETAAHFGIEATGNARAWDYTVEPIIRMRNTYFAPGPHSLEEMIAETKSGFLLRRPMGGQADTTGEFMFGVQEAFPIEDGKVGPLLKGVSISGVAFDLLSTVDRVSGDFLWDLGAGHCGKGQLAKVDAGGPYLRCKATVGGRAGD